VPVEFPGGNADTGSVDERTFLGGEIDKDVRRIMFWMVVVLAVIGTTAFVVGSLTH
jgi:hypothetical protein